MSADLSDDTQLGRFLHNNPPSPIAVEPTQALVALKGRQAELVKTGSAWLQSPPESQEDADRLTGYKRQVAGLRKEAEAQRNAERKPYGDAYDAVTILYKPILEACTLVEGKIEPLLRSWLVAEQKRKDAEAEAKRKAADDERRRLERLAQRSDPNDLAAQVAVQEAAAAAEEAQAEADRAQGARAHAGGGYMVDGTRRSAHLGTHYTYRVDGPAVALTALAKMKPVPAELIEAIEKAVRRMHRIDRSYTCPGVEIVAEERARG